MGVNSLPKTVTRQRRGCDLHPGPSAPESSTLTTRLPSHPVSNSGPQNPANSPSPLQRTLHGDGAMDVYGTASGAAIALVLSIKLSTKQLF